MRLAVTLATGLIAALAGGLSAGQSAARGTIKGHIRLGGRLPGNPVIRMRVDPICARINAGKQVAQEAVAAAADGSLANVFVMLQGTYPRTPVPTRPVIVDQRGCIYGPRVLGVRVGQVLEVRNSDPLLHNVHSLSVKENRFNTSQPKAGITHQFHLKHEEVMLQLKCDIHRWMIAYVGVVTHQYFAVSDRTGTFQIDNVPPGAHTIQAWHERYGTLTQTVRVRPGATTTATFTYTGNEKP